MVILITTWLFPVMNNVSIFFNNGDGTFQAAINYNTDDGPDPIFSADLDNDGDNDLALGNCYSNNVSILSNNGDGTFQEAVNYELAKVPRSIFLADLDNDLDLDLAISFAVFDANCIAVLINRTNQTSVQEIYALPQNTAISRNYPNPFNASTTIKYALHRQSNVKIDILDLLGRKVTTVKDKFQPASDHQVVWNAEGATSGIYFYKLQADDYIITKKMTLVR